MDLLKSISLLFILMGFSTLIYSMEFPLPLQNEKKISPLQPIPVRMVTGRGLTVENKSLPTQLQTFLAVALKYFNPEDQPSCIKFACTKKPKGEDRPETTFRDFFVYEWPIARVLVNVDFHEDFKIFLEKVQKNRESDYMIKKLVDNLNLRFLFNPNVAKKNIPSIICLSNSVEGQEAMSVFFKSSAY
jgi:hypothetical protein